MLQRPTSENAWRYRLMIYAYTSHFINWFQPKFCGFVCMRIFPLVSFFALSLVKWSHFMYAVCRDAFSIGIAFVVAIGHQGISHGIHAHRHFIRAFEKKTLSSNLMCFWSGRDQAINYMHNNAQPGKLYSRLLMPFTPSNLIQLTHMYISTDSGIYD